MTINGNSCSKQCFPIFLSIAKRASLLLVCMLRLKSEDAAARCIQPVQVLLMAPNHGNMKNSFLQCVITEDGMEKDSYEKVRS